MVIYIFFLLLFDRLFMIFFLYFQDSREISALWRSGAELPAVQQRQVTDFAQSSGNRSGKSASIRSDVRHLSDARDLSAQVVEQGASGRVLHEGREGQRAGCFRHESVAGP